MHSIVLFALIRTKRAEKVGKPKYAYIENDCCDFISNVELNFKLFV